MIIFGQDKIQDVLLPPEFRFNALSLLFKFTQLNLLRDDIIIIEDLFMQSFEVQIFQIDSIQDTKSDFSPLKIKFQDEPKKLIQNIISIHQHTFTSLELLYSPCTLR